MRDQVVAFAWQPAIVGMLVADRNRYDLVAKAGFIDELAACPYRCPEIVIDDPEVWDVPDQPRVVLLRRDTRLPVSVSLA